VTEDINLEVEIRTLMDCEMWNWVLESKLNIDTMNIQKVNYVGS